MFMNIPKFHREHAQEGSKYEKSNTGKNDYCLYSGSERIYQHDYREYQEQDTSDDHPAAVRNPESVHITAEGNDYKAVVEHPDSQEYRQQDHRDPRIDAQENSQQQIYHSSYDHIPLHHEVVAAGAGNHELGCTAQKHQHSEEDAQGHITLNREYEHKYSSNDNKNADNQHHPPMADHATSPFGKIFKMTFHNTKYLKCMGRNPVHASQIQVLC